MKRRSNESRSRETRGALLDAARALFVAHGYTETSTPMIVARAGTTRGALYHHFADKQAIFRAVVEREAARVADAIAQAEAETPAAPPLDRFLCGADAYLSAMQAAGRAKLMLVDGPAVLGAEAMRQIEGPHAEAGLRRGLQDLLGHAAPEDASTEALADLLSAMFERAALGLVSDGAEAAYREAIERIVTGLVRG